MSDVLKILPTLSTDQITRIAGSYAQDLAKFQADANWYYVAALTSVVVATIGFQSSKPIDKDEDSKSMTNRLLRTCCIWGAAATIYFAIQHIQAITKVEHAEEMTRFCSYLLPKE